MGNTLTDRNANRVRRAAQEAGFAATTHTRRMGCPSIPDWPFPDFPVQRKVTRLKMGLAT